MYFTRTTGQMVQIVQEIKKMGHQLSAVILSSKKNLCINEYLDTNQNNRFVKAQCKRLNIKKQCPFTQNAKLNEEAYKVMDIEDLRIDGKKDA